MKHLILASSGVEDFLCIANSPPTNQPDDQLPEDAKCVRVRTKSSIDGYCPPVGQKVPTENYIEISPPNIITLYEAIAGENCTIEYIIRTMELGPPPPPPPKFRYFRALILYGWSMQTLTMSSFAPIPVYPRRSVPGLMPLRYEVWYFEFDSLEDAYTWTNPRPYNLTPMSLSLEPKISITDNYQRGVGYASAIDTVFLNEKLFSSLDYFLPSLQNIDDENGTKKVFVSEGFSTDVARVLSGDFTRVRSYAYDFSPAGLVGRYPTYAKTDPLEPDLYTELYNLVYEKDFGYQFIPLWPLRRQYTTRYSDFSEEEKNSFENFSNLYIAGIEHVLPDRYFNQNPLAPNPTPPENSNIYPGVFYSLTPSLEKLDPVNTRGTAQLGFADLYIDWYYGRGKFFTNERGVAFSSATSGCSFPYNTSIENPIPRTLFYSPHRAVLYAQGSDIDEFYELSPNNKYLVKFPIKVSMRGQKGGGVRQGAVKLGISIVYAVQYGENKEIQKLPSYEFQDMCPPSTIPSAQWILNL